MTDIDDSFYPILGYHIGKIAPNDIPVICGLESSSVSEDDLKNFRSRFRHHIDAPCSISSALHLKHSEMLGLPLRCAGARDVIGKAQPDAARQRW